MAAIYPGGVQRTTEGDSGTRTSGTDEPAPRLAGAAVSGVAWQGLSYLVGKLIVLVATVVLARLLVPSEFGLVTLALVFVNYADVVNDLGVSQALVYLPGRQKTSDLGMAMAVSFSAVLTLGVIIGAPAIADVLGNPDVTPLLRVLAVTLLVSGIGQVPDTLLRKRLRFRDRMFCELSRGVFRGAASIILAVLGFGAWSLVWGQLLGETAYAAVAWARAGYRPNLRWWRLDLTDAKPLLKYGAPTALAGLLATLVLNVDYVIVGRALGTGDLGLYTLAFRIPEMLIVNVFYVVSMVSFPVLAMARTTPERLRRGYSRTVRLQSIYGVAAGVGVAMVAPMVVEVAFGSKWSGSIVPLQALALYAAFRSLGMGAVDLYKAVGRPMVAVWMAVIRLVVLVPALIVATNGGIDSVAWTQAALALPFAVMMQMAAARLLGLKPGWLLASVGPALAAGLGVFIGAGAVRWWLPGPEAARLLAALVLGAAGGAVGVLLADRNLPTEIRSLVRDRRGAGASDSPPLHTSRGDGNGGRESDREAVAPIVAGLGAVLVAALGVGLLVSVAWWAAVAAVAFAAVVLVVFLVPDTEWLLHVLTASVFLESLEVGGSASAGRMLAVLALAAVGLRLLLTTWNPPRPPRQVWIPVALFVVWWAASGLWSDDIVAWGFAMGVVGLGAAYFVAFATFLTGSAQLRRVLRTYVIGAVLALLPAVLQSLRGTRAVGLQGDPNLYAMYEVAAVPAALALARSATGRARTWWYLALVPILYAIATSQSRGGLLTLAVVVLFIMFRRSGPGALTSTQRTVLLGAVGAMAVLILATPSLSARLDPNRAGDDRGSGRADIWIVATDAFKAHPVTGLGAGNFAEQSLDLIRTTPGVELTKGELLFEPRLEAHNLYLQMLADVGVPGLSLCLLLLACTAAALGRGARRHRLYSIPSALPPMLLTYVVASMFLSVPGNKLLWILIGCAAALNVQNSRVTRKRAPYALAPKEPV